MKIDPQKFCIDVSKNCKSPKKKFEAELYVPAIPMPLVQKMFEASFIGLRVGIVCWRAFRMQGSRNPFKLTTKYLEPFKISRNQKYRGLHDLKKAGLIKVKQKSGQAPIITLLNIK
jgi:hypothetical protein